MFEPDRLKDVRYDEKKKIYEVKCPYCGEWVRGNTLRNAWVNLWYNHIIYKHPDKAKDFDSAIFTPF